MTEHSENTELSNSTKPVLTTALLSRYLPYGLKIYEQRYGLTYDIVGILESEIYCKDKCNEIFSFVPQTGIDKPILRPLSDLMSNISNNEGVQFFPIDNIKFKHPNSPNFFKILKHFKYHFELVKDVRDFNIENNVIETLISWHFDVFGLIEKGLAISTHDVDSCC